MATEIERKFLVNVSELPEKLPSGYAIEQGYLSRKPSVRVRIKADRKMGGETKAYFTIKGKGLIERPEFEYEIPVHDGVQLLNMCKTSLTKIRREIVYAGKTWEVDQFLQKLDGLWLAEIELSDANEYVPLPPWVGKEVTEDPRFTNASLSEDGLPRW
jgi:CYTH domain-containing protein